MHEPAETDLIALIERLEATPLLTEQEASRRWREHFGAAFEHAVRSGETIGQALGALPMLNQPYEDFKTEIKSLQDDLQAQVKIVNETLDGWFIKGMQPAPYYAWRVAVILAKNKRLDEERRFLAAWCRHFGGLRGARYEAITERARKRGVQVMAME